MKKLALAILLSSCVSHQGPIDVSLRNKVGRRIKVELMVDGIKKTVELEPGEEWKGKVDRIPDANTIEVVID